MGPGQGCWTPPRPRVPAVAAWLRSELRAEWVRGGRACRRTGRAIGWDRWRGEAIFATSSGGRRVTAGVPRRSIEGGFLRLVVRWRLGLQRILEIPKGQLQGLARDLARVASRPVRCEL